MSIWLIHKQGYHDKQYYPNDINLDEFIETKITNSLKNLKEELLGTVNPQLPKAFNITINLSFQTNNSYICNSPEYYNTIADYYKL